MGHALSCPNASALPATGPPTGRPWPVTPRTTAGPLAWQSKPASSLLGLDEKQPIHYFGGEPWECARVGQREQTVNLPAQPTVVRIHPLPFSPSRRPCLRSWRLSGLTRPPVELDSPAPRRGESFAGRAEPGACRPEAMPIMSPPCENRSQTAQEPRTVPEWQTYRRL